ncbi:MAG TPA: chemotaxis protein CheD [Cyclobacteriaceae bacterium]
MKRILNINDTHATSDPVEYTCYGLGSCIGLFISDRVKGLSGGAHIPLPEPSVEGEFENADAMISNLLQQLSLQGSDLLTLRAKVTGGARIYESVNDIGKQNINAVTQQLINRRIFIAAMDVGGKFSRTARYNSVTGELRISTSEQKTYSI